MDLTPAEPGAFRLEIGEIVLHGFPAAHRHRLADACEDELTWLCGGRTYAPPTGNLTGVSLSVQTGADPEATGTALARALHAALYPSEP